MDEHKQANEVNDSELFDKIVEENDQPVQPSAPVAEDTSVPVRSGQPAAPVQEVSSQPLPPQTAPVTKVPSEEHNKGGVIVLQWLTYAFWGWFASAFTILSGFVINSVLNSGDDIDVFAYVYPLSAVIVTFLFAMVADFFYRRYEPVQKTGASNVIMLIHAVLYILIAAGAMIGFVFALISYILGLATVSGNGSLSAVLIATVALAVFGAVALRVVLGAKKPAVRKLIWMILSGITAVIIIAAIAGPIAKSITLKEDRLLEQNLSSVPSLINDYVDKNHTLPASLSEVKPSSSYNREEMQRLLDSNLVAYKPNAGNSNPGTTKYPTTSYGKYYNYQLCVTYKAEKNGDRYLPESSTSGNYISASSHPKGNVCYDLYATDYSYGYNN
jgi:hypothetical protein